MSTAAGVNGSPHRTTTVIFDFDGTIALGSGPLVAFAQALARHSTPDVLNDALDALDDFEAGTSPHSDGYQAVTSAAHKHGIERSTLDAAYHDSRSVLGTKDAPVEFPEGLGEFLHELAPVAELWLVTNAPDTAIADVLRSAGLLDYFDQLHFSVGKPDGLVPLLSRACCRGPVLAIGDLFDNDLAPAIAAGAATALVGSTSATDEREVTFRAATLDVLYPEVKAWVAEST